MSQAKNIFLFFITEVDKSSSNLLMETFHFWIVFDVRWGRKGDEMAHPLSSINSKLTGTFLLASFVLPWLLLENPLKESQSIEVSSFASYFLS